ncbi:MAG: hypothetical protein Q3962_09670, partial [Corynebacterium sp.]|nr:hypothetical protein [Corynebacterium sp.]
PAPAPAPAPVETPAPVEAPAPAPAPEPSPRPQATLAVTGSDEQGLLIAALLLMVLGGTAFYIGRHRRWN